MISGMGKTELRKICSIFSKVEEYFNVDHLLCYKHLEKLDKNIWKT